MAAQKNYSKYIESAIRESEERDIPTILSKTGVINRKELIKFLNHEVNLAKKPAKKGDAYSAGYMDAMKSVREFI